MIIGQLSESGLIGTLSGGESLEGRLSGMGQLTGALTIPEQVGGKIYQGDYLITPKARTEQTLETAGKTMTEDVTVLPVPYYEVSNVSGNTVYIAEE